MSSPSFSYNFKAFDCVDVKKGKIDEAKTLSKAVKEDCLKNKNNQMEEFLIDIGAAAKGDLPKAKVANKKKRKFRGECKWFVVNLL